MNSPPSIAFAAIAVISLALLSLGCSAAGTDASTPQSDKGMDTATAPSTVGVGQTPATTPIPTGPPSPTANSVSDEFASPEAIEGAVGDIEESWTECLRSLPRCELPTLLEVRSGEQASEVAAQVEMWNSAKFSARNFESRAYEVLDIRIDDQMAEVDVCQVDATVVFVPADVFPGQPEAIVDDDWLSTTQTWKLEFTEGRWRASQVTNRMVSIGEDNNQCSIGAN